MIKAFIGVLFGAIIGTYLAFMSYPHAQPHIDKFFGIERHKPRVAQCEKVWPNTFENKVKRTE